MFPVRQADTSEEITEKALATQLPGVFAIVLPKTEDALLY
jgi:hypothetical protein